MTMKVAWNRSETASVVLAKVKEFTITENIHDKKYSVRGWYNKENYFSFGDDFETLPIAQIFLNNIHNKL
jgi:predicted Zn-dependent protease